MSYEVGGRADKLGNRYESRWVVNKLIDIIKEDISAVILEAVGSEEEGVDLIIINKDGSKEFHQCKGRNAGKEKWSIADLDKKNILQNSKNHLDENNTSKFILISPIPCMILHDMHERALNSNDSSDDFYEYQIKKSGKEIRDSFEKYCKYMDLNTSDEYDINRAKDYLSRTYVYSFADDANVKKSVLDKIELYFIGNSEVIYNLLSNYIIEENLLGHMINNDIIIKYLQSNGIILRNLALDKRIMPRINELNQEFIDSLNLINNEFIDRKEVDKILSEIKKGNSIIIHGKAGYGKSGCVYDILKILKSENIGVLSLKMDRRIPKESASKYGEDLDLPASPIHCIHELYKNEKAVIILDQLDAIRWTNVHSSTSIEVCKEMIRQVQQLNIERKYKISIVFICRTYDYENDKSIKNLFKNQNEDSKEEIKWTEIKIDELEDSDVEKVSGYLYQNFSKRMRKLLRVPNNLYIWSKLDSSRKLNEINSSNELIKSWIEQLTIKFEKKGYSKRDLDDVIKKMVSLIEQKGKLEINIRLMTKQSPTAISYLQSEGLIIDNDNRISFVHQSFFDYFLVENMLERVLLTENIIEVIGDKAKQTPMKRYQIQMLLQLIQEIDFELFIELGHQMLDSEGIRFFMKYLYLEVLGQSISITKSLESLIEKYINSEKYRDNFIDIVFMYHKVFILYLIKSKKIDFWLNGNVDSIKLAVSLLKSVNLEIPNEIIDVIEPYILKNEEKDTILYNCMSDEIYLDSDKMFLTRMKLIRSNPKFMLRHFNFNELFENNAKRALLMLKEMIIYLYNKNETNTYRGVNNVFYEIEKIDIVDGKLVCEILLPIVPKGKEYYSRELSDWIIHYRSTENLARLCISILKKAMKNIIANNVDMFLQILDYYKDSDSILINEILLESALELPKQYADDIINWIITNDGVHLLNRSGEKIDELYYTKQIISKFSPYCSKNVYIKLENFIYNYHEKDEVETLKYRIKTNSSKPGYHTYIHYWGEIQYSLLSYIYEDGLSTKSKKLIPVLKRRFKNVYLRHQKGESYGGFVTSTISPNAHLFSDKTWFKIITNKNILRRNKSKWNEAKGVVYESSIEQFSTTFGTVAQNNLIRFAKLVLTLPDDIDISYIYQIFKLIGINKCPKSDVNEKNWNPISIETCELIINKFKYALDDKNCARELCNSIAKRNEDNWSIDILKIISKLAKEHPNPEEDEVVVWDENDKEMKSFDMLWTSSINCVRGCAAEAIGRLLLEKEELLELFNSAIQSLLVDKNPAVRLSAINCIYSIYYINKDMSGNLFISLLSRDFRIGAHPYGRKLICLMYKKYKNELDKIIEKMFFSDDEDVCKTGAALVAYFYIKYEEFKNLLYGENELNKNQKHSVLSVSIDLFSEESYKARCNELLNLFLDEDDENSNLYNRLFWDKKIDIVKDKKLVCKLLRKKVSKRIINDFIEYLEDNDKRILEFSKIIFELCESIIDNLKKESLDYEYSLYGVEASISNLLMSLYEKTVNIYDLNQKCLDILDLMFESGIGNLRRRLNDVIKDY